MDNGYKVIEQDKYTENAKIKVVGVGGGGGNMLNYMIEKGIKDIEMICANTDAQALQINKAPIKIQLGKELTKGLGAGMEPEVGKAAAEESYDEIKRVLEGADLVFISAGMGGGTGTGAAPVIAKIAKELGALTIGVVTKPFRREGAKRAKLAEDGFNILKEECDSIVTILNQKLLSIIDRRAGMRDAYKMVDNVLFQAVNGITNIIIGEGNVNADFNDVKKVIMSHRGMALMGIGHKSGENSAYEALSEAIESPLLDDVDIMSAKGLLINTTINENYPLVDLDEAMDTVLGELMENIEVTIIQGEAYDNSLADGEIKITIIATGFDDNEKAINSTNKPNTEIPKHLDINSLTQRVAGGSDFGLELNGENIDIPTYMRNSKD
jgi:cell division protein FtsZ